MANDSAMPTVTTPKEGDVITVEYDGEDHLPRRFVRRVREIVPLDDGKLGLINEPTSLAHLDGSHDRLGDIILEADGVTCYEVYHLTSRHDYLRPCRLVGVNLPT